MNKKVLIVVIVLLVASGAIAVYLSTSNQKQSEAGEANEPTKTIVPRGETVVPSKTQNPSEVSIPPTHEQISSTMEKSKPYLLDATGQPTFGIVRVDQPLPGWFIVRVRVKGAGELGTVILKQSNDSSNPYTLVAGPATSFPPEYIQLPDAVRKAL